MRFQNITHFSLVVGEVPTTEKLIQEFERLLGTWGFKYYCIFYEPKPIQNQEELIVAANWPAPWVERYIAKKYLITDPTIKYLLRANRPFSWKQAMNSYSESARFRRMKAMMADGRANGLASGYIFPIFARNGLIGATTLDGPEDVELTAAEITHLQAALTSAFFRFLELSGRSHPDAVPIDRDIMLTHREIQTLTLLAEGLTSGDIAERLGVTANTVDWYVGILQEKLDARNRQHAVSIAFRQGLIS